MIRFLRSIILVFGIIVHAQAQEITVSGKVTSAQDGGELLLYRQESDVPIETVSPLYGRMIIFLSNEFPHEVAKTNKHRRSIAGWFRVNNSLGASMDPPG